MRHEDRNTNPFEKNVFPLEKHKIFFDKFPLGICFISADNTVFDFNKKTKEWFPTVSKGVRAEKIFKSSEIRDLISAPFKAKKPDPSPGSAVIELKTKKEEKFLKCSAFPVFGKENTHAALVIMIEDITERQLVERWIAEETASIQLKYKDQAKK